ncbi:MAG: hypothetical protein QOD72_2548 [Acidimicrobiaceae bacterium]|jgi:hypothetical protein|nr:hypothetical protein [Acidimicrobiaceae bacterium]
MTSPKPDDSSIPLSDDLGDTRALITPERHPVTGARVSGALQRSAKHAPPTVAPQRAATPRRPARWPVPVAVVTVVLGAILVVNAIRNHSATSDSAIAPTTAVATANANTTVAASQPAGPTGPLFGFDGTYRVTAENVHISGASGGFTSGRLERTGTTVVARYDGPSGSGTATTELPEGPATATCAADRWTCAIQWAGTFAVVLDGSLGRAVLQRADGTPLGQSKCNLPIPSDGTVTAQFGLVNKQPQVKQFRISTGTAARSADGCANAVVIGYDLVATRTL